MNRWFFHNLGGSDTEYHYGLLANALNDDAFTDREDLLLQELSEFDEETVITLAAMIEKMVVDLGGAKSINTDWLLRWREHRIKDYGEKCYCDEGR